jgi:hypothetical protein
LKAAMNEPLPSSSSEPVDLATGRADTTVATPSKRTLTATEKRIVLLLSLVVEELGNLRRKDLRNSDLLLT